MVVDQQDKGRIFTSDANKYINNSEDFIRFDEPRPYSLRSLTYYIEHVMACNVHRAIVYKLQEPQI